MNWRMERTMFCLGMNPSTIRQYTYVKLDSDSHYSIRMESREYYSTLFTIAGTNPYS